jgi:transketolase
MMAAALASTRQAAGEAILELAREGVDVVAVSADTSKSMFTHLLRQEFPQRWFDTGIAEQNMMMVCAGMAAAGKIAFAASYSAFTSMRCCEQLRTFIAYPHLNVKVIAGIGGFSAGIEGPTHVATEDLGIVRCIAGMVVLAPADAFSTKQAVKAAAAHEGPVYIRVGRDPSPVLFGDGYKFQIGRPVLHREGKDVTLVGTGLMFAEVLDAAELLAGRGISAEVIELHTLKPVLEPQVVQKSVAKTGNVITVEDHNVFGGLGTVVAEILVGRGVFNLKKVGLQDRFAESGTPEELVVKYGLKAPSIAEVVQQLLKR